VAGAIGDAPKPVERVGINRSGGTLIQDKGTQGRSWWDFLKFGLVRLGSQPRSDKAKATRGVTNSEVISSSPQRLKLSRTRTQTEILTWVDVFLWKRIATVVLQQQHYLEVERKKWILELEQASRRLSYHRSLTDFYNFYFVQSVGLLIFLAIGVVIGVNLPEAIVCRDRHTPCYYLRVR
jgi:hypothetical protein